MATRVKFCGITREQDLCYAAYLGVHAIGFVFCPESPRVVDVQQAHALSRLCPPFISRVGLFMNQDASTIQKVMQQVELDMLQFHGQEEERFCASFNMPYIKSVAMGGDAAAITQHYQTATALLLDSNELGQAGGSGKLFDWDKIPQDMEQLVILAGGLNPANVAEAVINVRPYAVDVSSGIESSKGIKDQQKMKKFIQAVRVADEC